MELNQDLEDFFASTFVKITKKEEERNVQNVEREIKNNINSMKNSTAPLVNRPTTSYVCEECDYEATQKHNLRIHMRRHNSEKLFKCDQCNYKGNRRILLRTHARSVHNDLWYKCEYCDFKASQKVNLKTHIKKKHEGNKQSEKTKVQIKTFPCDDCDKVWKWQWELKRHMRTHSRPPTKQETERNFECTGHSCNKRFRLKNDLKQHMRLHTGENLLSCDICQKKFTSKYAILHHVAVHIGAKQFQCALCGNHFTQPANLRTHVKNKHGDNTDLNNQCKYCGTVLTSITLLHKHMIDAHKGLAEKERIVSASENMKMEQNCTTSDVLRRTESVIKLNPYLGCEGRSR